MPDAQTAAYMAKVLAEAKDGLSENDYKKISTQIDRLKNAVKQDKPKQHPDYPAWYVKDKRTRKLAPHRLASPTNEHGTPVLKGLDRVAAIKLHLSQQERKLRKSKEVPWRRRYKNTPLDKKYFGRKSCEPSEVG